MTALMEDRLPDYYDVSLIAVQIDARVLGTLLEHFAPNVLKKMEDLCVVAEMWCISWFMCCFINVLPLQTVREHRPLSSFFFFFFPFPFLDEEEKKKKKEKRKKKKEKGKRAMGPLAAAHKKNTQNSSPPNCARKACCRRPLR